MGDPPPPAYNEKMAQPPPIAYQPPPGQPPIQYQQAIPMQGGNFSFFFKPHHVTGLPGPNFFNFTKLYQISYQFLLIFYTLLYTSLNTKSFCSNRLWCTACHAPARTNANGSIQSCLN